MTVTRYLVFSDLGIPGGSHAVYNSTALNVLEYAHTGLTPGVLYSYWLQVENFNGLSADLTDVYASQVRRYACAVPMYFDSLQVLTKSSTAITIEWSEPRKSTGCPIDGYKVLADDGASGTLSSVVHPDSLDRLPAT
jgi:hypothetical protein